MGLSESEASRLAGADGRVPLEALRDRMGATTLELAQELARAWEEAGRLSGQLKEVRTANLRLQKEIKEVTEERRRLTEEVLELRAAAEERLMLMERIEHISRIEKDLAKTEAELGKLRARGIIARLLNRR